MKRAGARAGAARSGLVLLHGRGGSAADMLQLAAGLALPDVAMIAPEAPGQSWWPTSFLAPMPQIAPFLEAGLAAIDAAVETLQAEGLARDAIGLCGFSQGACLALEYAARKGSGLSAVFGFSAGLVGTGDAPGPLRDDLYGHAGKRFDYTSRLDGLVVDMSCHERDPHIPLARFLESASVLSRLGAQVAHRTYPGAGHAVMHPDISALRAHLNRGPVGEAEGRAL